MLIWTFDDSLTVVGQAVEIVRSNTLSFNACLELDANGTGCYARQCQLVRLDSFPGFSAVIEFDSNMVALKAVPIGGVPPYSYSWDNGITSSTNQAIQPGGIFCVTITDNTSTEAVSCVQAALNPVGNLLCVASFVYQSNEESELIPIPGDSLQFKTVILEYVEDGVVYRSDRAPQPSGSFFLIDSVEPYKPNENNQPTLRIKARFSGTLWAENGDSRHVDEAAVVFAVAIP
ncbi:MAG: hypothetical protein IPL49_21250 [Saprospirales bacterium]|nr:hypothetical protein [Saprospirales bacterium]